MLACVFYSWHLRPRMKNSFEEKMLNTKGGTWGWWPHLQGSNLKEKGVAQGSMDAHDHQPSTKILGVEVCVLEVEQIMALAA